MEERIFLPVVIECWKTVDSHQDGKSLRSVIVIGFHSLNFSSPITCLAYLLLSSTRILTRSELKKKSNIPNKRGGWEGLDGDSFQLG